MLLPERKEEVLDFSLAPSLEETPHIPRQIISFCEGKVEKSRANKMAVAAEEMAVNTIKYGGRSLKSIDVMLSVSDEELVLRQRDDGIPFDPTEYKQEEGDIYKVSGITIIRRMVKKLSYVRVLNMNNTIIEV